MDNSGHIPVSFVFVVLLPLIPKIPVDRLARGAILVIVEIVAGPYRSNGQGSAGL